MTDEVERWTGYGSSLAGSLTGSVIGAATTGDPSGAIWGAGIGGLIETALAEASHRFTSDRQKKRIGAVVAIARDALIQNIIDGNTLRTDDLLRPGIDGRSTAEEIIEHIIQSAQRTYEEKKLPFLGATLANIAISPAVDEISAHEAIATIESLSWPKLVALAIIGGKDDMPVPDVPVGTPERSWTSFSAHQVFTSLYYEDGLVGIQQDGAPLPTGKESLTRYGLTTSGRLIYSLADLDRVSSADRDDLIRRLTYGEPGTTL